MIGLTAALPREVDGILRKLVRSERERVGACALHRGSLRGVPVVLAVTGMGAQRATDGARALLAGGHVTTLLSLGFAGALTDALPVGSLALPERLLLDGDPAAAVTSEAGLRARLLPAARAAGLEVHAGDCVTAPRMVTAPGARAALAAAHGAELVDMEGYWLAREAAAAGVPYASVRAVSDTPGDHHPVLVEALADGRLRVSRVVRGYAAHPREAAKLPRLIANARAAATALERLTVAALVALAGEAAA